METNRRTFLAVAGLGAFTAACGTGGPAEAAQKFEFTLTDAEWKKRLSPQAYRVLRQGATEYAFTSPLNNEHRAGTFTCAGCALPLFASSTKFDSGTGWPSFWQPCPTRW
jgi:peptide-methionine (R)-S-oxide reductase